MSKIETHRDKYLNKPKSKEDEEEMKEKLLYGDDEPVEEKERKRKEYQEKQLNEGGTMSEGEKDD